MSAFDTVSKMSGRAILTRLGQPVTYRGAGDDVVTVAVIDKQLAQFGVDAQITDSRWRCSLLVEDVGQPHRDDRVVDESGDTWVLEEEVESDRWVTDWAVRRK